MRADLPKDKAEIFNRICAAAIAIEEVGPPKGGWAFRRLPQHRAPERPVKVEVRA